MPAQALDMHDAAGMIVGFLPEGYYTTTRKAQLKEQQHLMHSYQHTDDEFAPVMKALSQQGTMGPYVELSEIWSVYIMLVFVFRHVAGTSGMPAYAGRFAPLR
jgi:putative ABC transport system permease protein